MNVVLLNECAPDALRGNLDHGATRFRETRFGRAGIEHAACCRNGRELPNERGVRRVDPTCRDLWTTQ
jgi:hypothetical protein